MKTKIFSLITGAALMFASASCDDNWKAPTQEDGSVSLASMGLDISDLEKVLTTTVGSRASVDVSPFIVNIYNSQGALSGTWAYSEMPEVVTLPVGKYRVESMSHKIQKAEWEKPYFYGSKEFEVTSGKITSVGVVTCKFSSLKVSIRFTDALRSVMGDDVTVTTVANDEGELTFTPAETRSGFFEVLEGSTTFVVTFQGTVKGYRENVRKVYTDVAPGQHRIITFDVKNSGGTNPDETGQIDPSEGVNLDVNVTDENISGNINTGEENKPEEEKPGTWEPLPTVPVVAEDIPASDITSSSVVLRGRVEFDNIQNVGFNYRAVGEPTWNHVDGVATSRAWTAGSTFSATVEGLSPETIYEYVVTADDFVSTEIRTFTTLKEAGAEAATFSSPVFDLTKVNKVSEITGEAKVNIECQAGIAHLVVTINSPSLTAEVLEGVGLMSKFDLAYPDTSSEPGGKDLTEGLSGLGFPTGAEVIGKTYLEFDITQFLPLLGIYGRYEHEFVLAVTDSNGLVSTCSLKLDSDN